MSEPNETAAREPHGQDDPLLRALRELPPAGLPEDAAGSAAASRQAREARAAFTRAFADEPWHGRLAAGPLRRFAVPVVLAGVALVYMSWAVGAAMKLMQ